MSFQEESRVGKLGSSTQVKNQDLAVASKTATGKVGATTLAAAHSTTALDAPRATDLSGGSAGEGGEALVASNGMLDIFDDLPDLDFVRQLVEKYLREGVDALSDYIVRQIFEGATSLASQALQRAWDGISGFPDALQRSLERVVGMRELTGAEIAASQAVHGSSLINYDAVRVMPSSFFTKLSQMRAFVSFNIIHYPHDQESLDTCCHECTHVAQYQAIGARYIPEAIHAQHTGGYSYGNLGDARRGGKTYKDFNREQQAQIAGDYYRVAVMGASPSSSGSGSLADYNHFIAQMRSGSYW